MLHLKVLVCKLTFVSTTKTCFHRENIRNLQLSPHWNSSSLLFRYGIRKPTLFKTKIVTYFREQIRKNSCLMRHFLIVIAIHEDIFSSTMTVQITVKHYISFFFKRTNKSLSCTVFWVQSFWRIFPPTVQILANETTSVVPINYPVRIQHRDYFENEVVPQNLSFGLVTYQKVNNTFHHPRAIAFTWMYTSRNKDSFLLLRLIVLWLFFFIRDCNVLAAVTCYCPSQ